jgi:hypothetical protein
VETTARRPWWLALALGAVGITALYAGALTTGFLNDDHVFLEQARTRSLLDALLHPGGIANYFRPLSREVYFAVLLHTAGMQPLAFHLVNLAALLVSAWLVFDLLLVLVPPAAAITGTLWMLLLPLIRVDLIWISCSQDLLALLFALTAFALHRRGRDRLAWLAYLAAVLSKQSALPLPAALVAYDVLVAGRAPREAMRRAWPYLAPLAVWAVGEWHVRQVAPVTATVFSFTPGSFAAGYVHMLQSLLGLEAGGAMWSAFQDAGPSVWALAALAPIAFWIPSRAAAAAPDPHTALPAAASITRFALLWLALFGLMTGPVASTWSGYYYTLAAVGGSMLVALLARRITRWTFVALVMALLWWHAAASSVPAFAIADAPWGWTGHFTNWYFERGARISSQLRLALLRSEPHPAPDTRFFFATLPGWAGFQMGNGPAIRDAYQDDSLQSFFYSQFSESTAADLPCRFLFWNGVDFEPLYSKARDPFFQVGCDLLLLERPHGARHAFRRGLTAGEDRRDHTYWYGWASLWDGDRAAAEAAWKDFGAADDTTMYVAWLRAARTALEERDTLSARRHLMDAVRAGIGRPEAHAALGELLSGSLTSASANPSAKYGLLETRVAAYLNPQDWLARRDLVQGLAAARLDQPARHELQTLEQILPEWRRDSVVVRLDSLLRVRSADATPIVHFARHARLASDAH